MSQEKSHAISLKPSDATADAIPLNVNSRRDVKEAVAKPFQQFCSDYASPPLRRDDYFDMRNAPNMWAACTEKQSRSHLFLYTLEYMATQPDLKNWLALRSRAMGICEDTGSEGSLLWLDSRPKYMMRMISTGKRCVFPAWNVDVLGRFHSFARPFGLTGRILFITHSIKILLDSGIDLKGWRQPLANEWAGWEIWLKTENQEISKYFSLK